MPCNLDGKLFFFMVSTDYVVIAEYWNQFNACHMYVQVHICIMQVYFLLKIVLHCFFCLINWDPKVHRIDASHSHKS